MNAELMPDLWEASDYLPAIIPAFVTGDDPAMRQVAEGVAAMAGVQDPSADAQSARKFMAALYEFMSQNKFSYQYPPGGSLRGA